VSFLKTFGRVFDVTVLDNPTATQALEDCYGLMADDLCEKVGEALSLLDEPTDLQWLIEYMKQHYNLTGSHFEWIGENQ
jgi:hypothetical protein